MAELGDYTEEGHRLVGEAAAAAGLDALICVGKLARTIAESAQAAGFPSEAITMVKTAHDAVPVLLELAPGAGDAVLVKASHSMELNRVVEGLMA